MASKDDSNPLRGLIGISPLPSNITSLVPDHSRRWSGPPVPIMAPGLRYRGNSAVRNPHKTIEESEQAAYYKGRTNPTANRTHLSDMRPHRIQSRKSTSNRLTRNTSIKLTRNKGKGKAIERCPLPTNEIIDVDAEAPSTDDLDFIPDHSPTLSHYFDSRRESGSRMGGSDGPSAGPALIDDGENTKVLRTKIESVQIPPTNERNHTLQQTRESSPIEAFSEDETLQVKRGERYPGLRTDVKGLVAKFEMRSQDSESIPVINFKKPAKERMQPRQPRPTPLKFTPTQIARDFSSESGLQGIPARTKGSVFRLPISALVIGKQELRDYPMFKFDGDGRTMSFEGNPGQAIGPIFVTNQNFAKIQYTDFQGLDNAVHPPILYLASTPTARFGSCFSSFNGVFRPGSDNEGQISIMFNTSHKHWNAETFRSAVDSVARPFDKSAREVLRPSASKTLWTILSRGIKFRSGGLSDHACDLAEPTEELGTSTNTRFLKDTLIESPSGGIHVDEFQQFRHSPASDSAVTVRKRSSNPSGGGKALIETTVEEPPPKRQRVEESRPLRRSTRRQEKSPSHDTDEVILIYPYGVPGAVNVTAGDLARLQPEEFLNDTLIEFGLKVWLKELEITNPDIASQVHVFSSFFYKKLNKRNIREGYDSVRKWTSRIDIFSKKYIVVPINENLHWYLAIIYEPEHILQVPPLQKPNTNVVTRQQRRETQVTDEMAGVEIGSPLELESKVQGVQTPADVDGDTLSGTTSETEVERLAFLTSRSTTAINGQPSTMYRASEPVSKSNSPEIASGSPMDIDADPPAPDAREQRSRPGASEATMGSGTTTPSEIPDDSQWSVPFEIGVSPAKFYRKRYIKRPRGTARNSIKEPTAVDISLDIQLRTRIFILDSLGNRHPQAMKQLNKWLELEAIDKKKTESATLAITKMAPVPVQPNYCDCGLYVLHFTQTFMSDPQKYCQIIMTKERPTMQERMDDWLAHSVPTMRDELRLKILSFSDDWRQQRAAREQEKWQQQLQQKAEEEEEDSDVAIVEHVKTSGKKGRITKNNRTRT